MSKTLTLSINLVTQDGSETDTAIGEAITVTHLAARIFAPGDSGPARNISPGLAIALPTGDSVELTVDDESIRLSSGMALVVSGAARMALPAAAVKQSEALLASLHIIELNARVDEAGPLRDLMALPMLLNAEHAYAASHLFEQLTLGDASSPLPVCKIDILPHLTAIGLVSMLLRAAGEDSEVRNTQRRGEQATRLREFLFKNLDHCVTTEEMARHLGMSRTLFFRWAKQALGCPPLKYLRVLRLERCQEWIAQDAAPLEEIAAQTGFFDASHLGREFKKHFGMTPAQYRKTPRSTAGTELLVQTAERYFRHGRFDEALAACEQGLKAKPPDALLDRLRYQKGLCLRALGRGKDAITEWQALRISGFSHRAGIQECRQRFLVDTPGHALDLLRDLHTGADNFRREDVVSLWIDQATALLYAKKPQPLRKYLALRKELFPHDMRSITVTVNALRMLGDNMEVPEQCGDQAIACYHALRRAGKYDEAVARYGTQVPPVSIVHGAFLQGRYEAVLTMEPERPHHRAEALVELGRAEEAIQRYPDHSACAYLALGRYEELLERFQPMLPDDQPCTAALLALGRTKEVDDTLSDPAGGWKWSPVLVGVHPDAALESRHPDASRYANQARALVVLNALLANDSPLAEEALEQIEGIRSPDFWWYDHNGSELLIVALLRGLLGYPDALHCDLDEIVAHHKYKDKQALWHDAAYLSGTITAAEYRAQPQQMRIDERLPFIQAVANDLKGRRQPARKGYEKVLTAAIRPFDPPYFIRQRFTTWRLREL